MPDATQPHHGNQDRWLRLGVPIGAGLFILALLISAVVVPPIRRLHFFQALIYVAVILLARRRSAWGLGAGVAIAIVWNSLQLFVTHLMQSGAALIWLFLRTGQVRRLETMMVAMGWAGHCVLIVSCAMAMVRAGSSRREWGRFAGGAVLVLVYFGIIVATLLPP